MQLKNHISSGNIKVPKTTAIFNMSSAHDCPSRKLGLCKASLQGAKCYALKAEYKYHPAVLPYRRRQEKIWKSTGVNDFVSQFLSLNKIKRNKYKALRFNESGDFHSQKYVNKAELIAKKLSEYGIKCYCYTSRSDLNFNNCKYLIISGSGFKKSGVKNEFKIIGKNDKIPNGYGICAGNCRICSRCLKVGLKTVVRKH